MGSKQYCMYCGRVAHRCVCGQPDSNLRQFLERGHNSYIPGYRHTHYKRAVPPQIKRQERATMRKHYNLWYEQLVVSAGESCANCGETDNLAIDHILPIAKGGLSTLENLQLLCATCNRIKGKLMIDCRTLSSDGHDDEDGEIT